MTEVRKLQGESGKGTCVLSEKGHERTFWDAGNVLYLNLEGGGYTGIYTHVKNPSSSTLETRTLS